MIYIFLWIVLFYMGWLQLFTKQSMKSVFLLSSIFLIVITSLRYGLGTDYFAYQYHYYLTPNNIIDAINFNSHMDIGFRFLISIFRIFDLKFYIFTACLSFFTFLLYIITIKRNSKKTLFSLFFLFSLYWIVYINSALRQGISMAIFIYAFYEFLNSKNSVKYIVYIFIAFLFHKASLIALLVLIVSRNIKKYFFNKKLNILLILMALFFFLIKGDLIIVKIFSFIGVNISYESGSFNIFAILLRIVNISVMYYLYRISPTSYKDEKIQFQLYIYFLSVLLFISISNMQMLSRAVDLIMVIEIILLPNLLSNTDKRTDKLIISSFIICLSGLLFFKDLNADLKQGQYYNSNIWNYPYVTIIDREEIIKYRSLSIGKIE